MATRESYDCKVCGATFGTQHQLDNHTRNEHARPSRASMPRGPAGSSKGTQNDC